MKHYQQEGTSLKRVHMHESGNICECCKDFNHAGYDESEPNRMLHDDAECKECNSLCCCSCHRDKDPE